MTVVLKGEQQNDGSFTFKASSEQVDGLNKMCDGNLNTELNEVQFGMKMIKDDVKLQNITATFTFPYITRIKGFNASTNTIQLPVLSNRTYTIKNKNYTSLTELFDEVCAFFKYDIDNDIDGVEFGDGYGSFRQELSYDRELIKQYILSMTMSFRCYKSTSPTYPVDVVNNMTLSIYSYNLTMNQYASIISKDLMQLLDFKHYIKEYSTLINAGYIQIDDEKIRFRFSFNQNGNVFSNNCIFFSPVNNSNNTTYYGKNTFKTGLVNYAPNDTEYQFKTNKLYVSSPPKYLYFDCPQLSTQNIALPDGRTLNLIAKTICTVDKDQYFIMSTTEPLRELTIQNVVNTKFVLKIYNEQLEQKTNFDKAVMILKSDMPKSRQVVKYHQDRTKLSVNVMNITEQQ